MYVSNDTILLSPVHNYKKANNTISCVWRRSLSVCKKEGANPPRQQLAPINISSKQPHRKHNNALPILSMKP